MRLINRPDNSRKVIFEIYKRMYKESEPSVDFDELFKKGITSKPNWFFKYYLSIKRQCEIIDEIVKEFNIPTRDTIKLKTEIHLGCSPNSSKENWEKERG